jgi:hypothetical protein
METYRSSRSVAGKRLPWVFHLGWEIVALGTWALLNQPLALEMCRGPWVFSKNLIPAGMSSLVFEIRTSSGRSTKWCGILLEKKGMKPSKEALYLNNK